MSDADPFAVALLPIASLEPHPRNAQIGDVGAVATAIAVDGFHLAVLAQAPTKQRKQPRIIAGHTRWRALAALQERGWDDPETSEHYDYEQLRELVPLPPAGLIPVQLQEMTDLRATRKLISDNRASALATTDDAVLVQLLGELAESHELVGTLFDGDDLDALIADLDSAGAGFSHRGQDGEVTCPSCGATFVPEGAD